jgi:hydrogenase nickel incorporation protein HypA/HybF
MHEMALSEELVRTAVAAAGGYPGRIRTIAVRVGALSGVNMPSFEFCLQACLKGMGMADARAELTWVPARFECRCGETYEADDLFSPCPHCGEFGREIVDGRDVFIEHLEVEDAQG